jgi:inhibitor of cysteine peptidase
MNAARTPSLKHYMNILHPKCIRTTLLTALLALASGASAEDSKPFTVEAGKEFSITLDSNPTTGYQWQLAKPLDETRTKYLANRYVKPESKLAGAGGKQVWEFRALRAGKTEIDLEYVRPWEQGVQPAQTTNFVVVVTATKETSQP